MQRIPLITQCTQSLQANIYVEDIGFGWDGKSNDKGMGEALNDLVKSVSTWHIPPVTNRLTDLVVGLLTGSSSCLLALLVGGIL